MTDVRPGQVWADCDSRNRGRTLLVLLVDEAGEHATCEVLTDAPYRNSAGKRRVIRVSRMRPSSTGYRLLREGESA